MQAGDAYSSVLRMNAGWLHLRTFINSRIHCIYLHDKTFQSSLED